MVHLFVNIYSPNSLNWHFLAYQIGKNVVSDNEIEKLTHPENVEHAKRTANNLFTLKSTKIYEKLTTVLSTI